MTAVLTSIAPVVLALAVAGGILLLALRRRQAKLIPAYVRRPEAPAQSRQAQPQQPQPVRRPARGCNW